jgi:non-ribosomal peptide synthase protein (TIGR01720 family)
MYKTGDLVRWADNGTLSYIGRKDQQVKVRGQRLELEDIESKILHDGLDRKVIIQPTKGPFAKGLVALFTMRNRPSQEKSETEEITLDLCEEAAKIITHLRTVLSERLPDYMLPDKWIPVARMPLSSAAKTNRKHLVQYAETMSEATQDQINNFNEESHILPHDKTTSLTPMEKTLQTIWSQLLNVPVSRIHGRTSFLGIGGDSVSAMQFVSQCRSHGLSLSVRDVLQFKILSKVAQRARPIIQKTEEKQVDATRQTYPLSPIQQMFLDTLTTEHIPGFSQSFSLQVNLDIEPEKLDCAIQTIVSRNHILQARFSRDSEGKWSQCISRDLKGSYSVQFHAAPVDREIVPILTKACRERLNPSKGPVITCEVFKYAGKNLLFLAAHHLVIDLVSWRIILKDLELLLQSKDLPPVFSLSFPEWCVQQEKWSSANLQPDRVLPVQLSVPRYDYWGMDDKTNTYGMAKIYTASISPASSSKILSLCANNGRLELQDILIVALAVAFKRVFSDRELPPIFLEHHGREPWLPEIDITQTVGWFTTLLPVFGLVLGDVNSPDIADILRRARDCRRQVPANGWEFFSSTFLHPQGRDAFRKLLQPEIMLNFEGFFQQLERADGMFEIAQFDGELADMSQDTSRLALLEFSVQVHNGHIGLSCIYNQNMLHTDRVEQCMGEFAQFLSDLPDLLSETTRIYSTSDFPRVSLSYHDLDSLMEPIIGNGIEDIYPILPIQSLMLTEQALHPFLYAPRLEFRVKSHARSICHADISRAWREVVKRHSALRTIFVNDTNGRVKFQVVLTEMEPRIIHFERNEEITQICPRQFAWPQDKLEAPHQLTIYSHGGEDIVLLLEITHALVDVATVTILLEDLVKGIEGGSTENTSPGVGYGDLIDHVFAQSVMASSARFWRDSFSTGPDTLLVPGPSTSRRHGELHTCVVPIGETVVSIRAALHSREISLPSVFRLAWARVIQRHLGIDDVTFGFVLSGRDIDIPHIHEMAGPLLNFTPCRVNLTQSIEDTSVAESLLKRLDSDYIQSLAHQSHASTVSTQSFDTIINFRKHKIDQSIIGNHENVWLEMVESVDPYHVSLTSKRWKSAVIPPTFKNYPKANISIETAFCGS